MHDGNGSMVTLYGMICDLYVRMAVWFVYRVMLFMLSKISIYVISGGGYRLSLTYASIEYKDCDRA